MAACSLLLNESRDTYTRPVTGSLKAWGRFMKHEANGVYTPVYAHWVMTDADERRTAMAPLADQLASFPIDKVLTDDVEQLTARLVQPLANRPVDTNYWKANPFERAEETGQDFLMRAAGMDYLLSYWMSRYFDLLE